MTRMENWNSDWVIAWRGGYVRQHDGMNLKVDSPSEATSFDTQLEASNARPGHDKAMGGSGQTGRAVQRGPAQQAYERGRGRQ